MFTHAEVTYAWPQDDGPGRLGSRTDGPVHGRSGQCLPRSSVRCGGHVERTGGPSLPQRLRATRHGIAEIDLLAIRCEAETSVIGWHVEVQASFRPVGYIAKLTDDMVHASNRARTSAIERTADQIETCAREWVQSKFKPDAKAKAREGLWPHVQWQYHLVHARVRERRELEVFQMEGVTCHSFRGLLADLSRRRITPFPAPPAVI
jgi:hypothetical protein